MDELYLLDTNVLVHYVRGDAVWQHVQSTFFPLMADQRPVISVDTVGELRSLAHQFNWQEHRRSQMDFICNYFRRISLDDPRVLDSYAMIDAHTVRLGRQMGKNDVWIAATAHVFNARILTTDRGFDEIHPVFVRRLWIDPMVPPAGGP